MKPEELHAKLLGSDTPAAQAAAVAAHLPALLALADAVRARRDARCWSLGGQGESTPRPGEDHLCWCGGRDDYLKCPIALADEAVFAAYERLEAVR